MLDSVIAHLVELLTNEPEKIAELLLYMVLVDIVTQLLMWCRTGELYKKVSQLEKEVKRWRD